MKGSPLSLLSVAIRRDHDVILCRQRARQLAEVLGYEALEQTQVATAVSEIARNALEYAGRGNAEFAVSQSPDSSGGQQLVVTIRDHGPGMPPDGSPSAKGLGLGLPGARRLVDDLTVDSRPGATVVTLRKNLPAETPALSVRELQAAVDRVSEAAASTPLAELQQQNHELIRALEAVHGQKEDLGRINQELAATNSGVLALYDELETLHRVGVLLASQLDLKTLLQAIVDATTELTDAHFGAFFFRDAADGSWQLQASSGPARATLVGLPVSYDADFFGKRLAGESEGTEAQAGPPVSSGGETKFAQALQDRFALKSCLTVPVANETVTLGAMVFGSGVGKAFTERSERIVSSIAAQAVIGIEKARLFERVQNSSAAKDRFLAMLSHELRTPLNPVLAVVSNLIGDQRLPADVQQDLGVALRNVRLEARLIDDLLDFSRIINGKLQLHQEPLDLHTLIRGVVDICAEDIAAHGHRIELRLDAGQSLVFGDSARLQQVLWNVLKNAVKFTPKRGQISLVTTGADAGKIAIIIADNGAGIETAALARIFDAFEQGGPGTTARFGGLGLGLAITKAFVELHGGTIHASSAGPGQGTQITIRLPLLGSDNLPSPANADPAAVADANEPLGGTLLVVDDHVDTLNIMSRLLSRRGYRVITAVSCQTALETIREQPVDLIVSDLGLPDGSGLSLLAGLRESCNVPAVALSGYGMESDVQMSHAAGYDDHLTKPIDFPLLMQTVARLLARGRP